MTAKTRYVVQVTEIPGPESRRVLARMKEAVPRAVAPMAPVMAARARGSLLEDVDGNVFIDLSGGVGVLNVGHAHERVQMAVRDQVERFLHTDFTVVPYASYVELARRLNARYPGGGPARTAFFNSGAEAVENAVKIARLYTRRPAIIAFERGFHGRTLMAMSLTSKVSPYKAGMGPYAPEVYRVPYPYPYRCPRADRADHVCDEACYAPAIERALMLQVDPGDVAAVIVEPVQGEGGFVVPPPGFLPWLREFTRRHGMLLIADEVQTGFGRTGQFFACDTFGVVPDLMTIAKSIADGLPLSAVMGRPEVMDAPADSQIGGTFVGNPVGIAAAGAVLDLFDEMDLLAMARRQGAYLTERLRQLQADVPAVGDVRGLGAMVAMELVRSRESQEPAAVLTDRIIHRCLARGVIVLKAGIYGNVIRFLAPLTTPMEVLAEALDIVEAVVREEAGRGG